MKTRPELQKSFTLSDFKRKIGVTAVDIDAFLLTTSGG